MSARGEIFAPSDVAFRGIPEPLSRTETKRVEEQLQLGNPVVLTGEAGTGKSGIGVETS